MSPEYTIDGFYLIKSNVYNYGVLVLDRDSEWEEKLRILTSMLQSQPFWTCEPFIEGRSIELLDPLVEDSSTLHEVVQSIHVGLLCVQQKPQDRSSMPAAVLILSGEGASPQPQKPGFFSERNLTEPEDSTYEATECSANELTVTQVGAR